MAVFAELDWRRLDVSAIVSSGSLAVIHEEQRVDCQTWLGRHNYVVKTLDFQSGLDAAIVGLGRMLNWEGQFGYTLTPEKRNLNAIRDGFEFDVPDIGGCVLEILGADLAWQEDPSWLLGLLSIARERSLWELAQGRRFFTVLILPDDSPLMGTVIEETRVPGMFMPRGPRSLG